MHAYFYPARVLLVRLIYFSLPHALSLSLSLSLSLYVYVLALSVEPALCNGSVRQASFTVVVSAEVGRYATFGFGVVLRGHNNSQLRSSKLTYRQEKECSAH